MSYHGLGEDEGGTIVNPFLWGDCPSGYTPTGTTTLGIPDCAPDISQCGSGEIPNPDGSGCVDITGKDTNEGKIGLQKSYVCNAGEYYDARYKGCFAVPEAWSKSVGYRAGHTLCSDGSWAGSDLTQTECPGGAVDNPKPVPAKTSGGGGGYVAPKTTPPVVAPPPPSSGWGWGTYLAIGVGAVVLWKIAKGLGMYAGFGAAALLSPLAGLRRDPAVGARLSRLRAFWPSSTYLSAIAPPGFAAAEADPRAGLEALVNQVLDANAEARAAIARTGQSLTVSSSKAKSALAAIQAWRNDNAAELDALAKLPADTVVPDNLRLRLPPDEARAFVSALWYDATVGIGLYETGFAMRAMEQGDPEWTAEQIRADLGARLQSYRLLLAMDAEGSLAPALSGQGAPAGGVSGLGITWQVGLLIFGIVVAVVGLLMYFANRGYETWARWQRYDSLCDAAKKSGDSATIKACQETVTNIPQPTDPATVAIMVAGGVAFAFIFTYFVIPKWLNR